MYLSTLNQGARCVTGATRNTTITITGEVLRDRKSLGIPLTILLVIVLLGSSIVLDLHPSFAQVPLSCGSVITSSTTLPHTIGPCPGNGLTIEGNGIVLNCAGQSVIGTAAGVGINVTRHTGVTIKNCNVSKFANGIYLLDSSGDTLTSNTVHDNNVENDFVHGGGIVLDNSSYNTLSRNVGGSNGGQGFALFGFSNYNTLSLDKAISTTGIGFLFEDASSNILSKDTASSNSWAGFELAYSSIGNTLVSNTATGSTEYLNSCGFCLAIDSSRNTLIMNTADSSQAGIDVETDGNTLISNTANSNLNDGIDVNGTSNTLTINTANYNRFDGFYVDNTFSNTLVGNTAKGNLYNGFDLDNSSRNTFASNTASNNIEYGFHLSRSFSNVLNYNTANSNKMLGYYDDSIGKGTKTTANFYTGNVCSGNAKGGSSPKGLGSPQQ
jgi:parallel beta-helix repeat protein